MATLVVENGTGVSGANTYISETDAITYINNYTPYKDAFVGYVAANFQLALIQAAIAMDYQYGDKYLGEIVSSTQALLFPRTQFWDRFGRDRSQGTIPTELKNAQVELAVMIYNGTDPFAAVSTDNNVTSKSVAIQGAISTSVTYSKPVQDEMYVGLRRVERNLQAVMKASNKITRISL